MEKASCKHSALPAAEIFYHPQYKVTCLGDMGNLGY